MKWLHLLLALTIFNLAFDHAFKQYGRCTSDWQMGMMTGLLLAWLITNKV